MEFIWFSNLTSTCFCKKEQMLFLPDLSLILFLVSQLPMAVDMILDLKIIKISLPF